MNDKTKYGGSSLKNNDWKTTILCYFIPFVVTISIFIYYAVTSGMPAVGGYYLIHYLYTYDHGFIARGLVGEILSLFFDKISDTVTSWTVIVFSLCLILSSSLCMGKALSKTKRDRERFVYVSIMLAILCFLPSTFRSYFIDIKLDKMLWAMTLFAAFFLDRKYLIWLAPVFCIIATLINPVFLFCSMILIAIVLLQEFFSSGYSVKNGIICGFAYFSMIALGLYGTIMEKFVGFKTPREMVDYYFSRYSGATSIDYYSFENEWLYDYFEPLKTIFKKSFQIYFIEWGNAVNCICNFIFLALPVLIILALFWKTVIKCETNKFQKFIYFLCAVSPVVLIPPISISWEASKYFANNFIVQLCLIVYFVIKNNDAVVLAIRKAVDWCKRHIFASACGVVYLGLMFI